MAAEILNYGFLGRSRPQVDPPLPGQRVIGGRPRPRVLLVGALPDDVVATVRELAPSVLAVDDIREIRQEEWDVVVTASPFDTPEGAPTFARHLHVLAFADPTVTPRVAGPHTLVWAIDADLRVRCNEFVDESDDGVPEEFRTLIVNTLIPYYRSVGEYWTFTVYHVGVIALGKDGDGHPLGVVYSRPHKFVHSPAPVRPVTIESRAEQAAGPGMAVAIPAGVAQRKLWVRQAFRYFARWTPASFANVADWDDDPAWQDNDERLAVVDLERTRTEFAAAVAEYEARIETLADRMIAARQAGRDGIGRLLRSQGVELVAAVADALTALGFEVVDSDSGGQPGDRLEDLQIRDPNEPGWVAIAEVRGYGGGAALNDLARIERFVRRFRDVEGRWPSRRWYVVNQFINQPPGSRPAPLANHPAEVNAFAAADDGLVLDTRALFQMLQQPPDTYPAVRARLRASVGTITDAQPSASGAQGTGPS